MSRQSRFEWGQITQYDESGVVVSQLTLGNAFVTDSQTSGLSNGELADEYGLSYTTYKQQVGTASATWNFVTNKEDLGFAALNVASAARSALVASAAPANDLVLELNDGINPAIVIPLNKFDYEYENQYPNGTTAVSVYKPLTINFDLTNSSPALFTAMARGKLFGNASIKKYDGDRLVAGWLLNNVLIKSDNTTSEGSQTTKTLTLDYTNLVNVAGTQTKLQTSSPSTTYGQSLTFTATVTSSGAAVNTGSVSFSIGSTQLGSVPVNASGQAIFTTSSLDVSGSPYTVQATYVPSTTLIPSEASVASRFLLQR